MTSGNPEHHRYKVLLYPHGCTQKKRGVMRVCDLYNHDVDRGTAFSKN